MAYFIVWGIVIFAFSLGVLLLLGLFVSFIVCVYIHFNKDFVYYIKDNIESKK